MTYLLLLTGVPNGLNRETKARHHDVPIRARFDGFCKVPTDMGGREQTIKYDLRRSSSALYVDHTPPWSRDPTHVTLRRVIADAEAETEVRYRQVSRDSILRVSTVIRGTDIAV